MVFHGFMITRERTHFIHKPNKAQIFIYVELVSVWDYTPRAPLKYSAPVFSIWCTSRMFR